MVKPPVWESHRIARSFLCSAFARRDVQPVDGHRNCWLVSGLKGPNDFLRARNTPILHVCANNLSRFRLGRVRA
jgi:hypothetical protein